MEKKRLKKLFPKLAEEMESGESKTDLEFDVQPPKPRRRWEGYEPNAIDYIRRCETEERAKEIIDYLESRDELTPEEAEKLRTQLEEKGLRSFGRRKTAGFYERKG